MKALAINGSPHKNGNTGIMLDRALARLTARGVECETLSVAGKRIDGCIACMGCRNAALVEPRCTQDEKDDFKGVIEKILAADVLLVGSPVYFGSATAQVMGLLHRVGYALRGKKVPYLKNKIGAAVVVARRAGQNFTFAQLNYFFLINEMIVPGSTYWNNGVAGAPGEVKNDTEGMATMDRLGDNIADLLEKLKK
ncbi:MAG: flavodoxin family protein [Fibrobacterota bacterium]